MVTDFEEPEPKEAVDIEVVLDTKTLIAGTESRRHIDTGSMAWEKWILKLGMKIFHNSASFPLLLFGEAAMRCFSHFLLISNTRNLSNPFSICLFIITTS